MLFVKIFNEQLLSNFQKVFLDIILPIFQQIFACPGLTRETLEKSVQYVLTFQKADFRGLQEIARLQNWLLLLIM